MIIHQQHLRVLKLLMLFLISIGVKSQEEEPFLFLIAELNTENFFDCTHDDGHDDYEFLPESGRRWNHGRFWKKLQNISKEIISMSVNGPVDVVALTEVENDTVLTWLTQRSILRRVGYHYVMTHGNDERGMNVALLYLPETFKMLDHYALRPQKGRKHIRTRDVLYVKGRVLTDDTIHLFVCHMPSKLGGRQAMKNRIAVAETIRKSVDSIQAIAPSAKIVITGDFNDTPTSKHVATSLQAHSPERHSTNNNPRTLFNLSNPTDTSKVQGTYKYDGRWEMIDQIIVSSTLLDTQKRFYTSPHFFQIWHPSFLLTTDNEDQDIKPKRTYEAYKYIGGFSDHLPIRLTFYQYFTR